MSRIVIAAGVALSLVIVPDAASADPGRQEHAKLEVAGFVEAWSAGVVCDFGYQLEGLGGSVTRIRFYDAEGNRVRVILIGVETLRHTNLETGYVLEETIHGTIQRDLLTGEETHTGNFWHPRDVDGKLVLAGSGRFVLDLLSGELLEATPHAGAEFAPTICPALGGAPAAP
jgi:hypothetical protein